MHRREQETGTVASTLDEASRALFTLGRAFGRMPLRNRLETRIDRDVPLSAILIVQAIAAADLEKREVTVGTVAAQLGVDPSTASRLVAQAERAGFLRRVASEIDGRVRELELTDAGRELGESAARYQRAVFEAATAEWSDEERTEFARRFVRFAGAIIAAIDDERRP